MRAQFEETKKLMCMTANIAEEDLSQVQKSVIFAHFVVLSSGLKCINRRGEVIEFPEDWHQDF